MSERPSSEDGPLALRFANTFVESRGSVRDLLADPVAVLTWVDEHLVGSGHAGFGSEEPTLPVARELFGEARSLRHAVRAIFEQHAGIGPASPPERRAIERALEAGRWRYVLTRTTRGTRAVRTAIGTDPLAVLAPVALSALETIANVEPGRLGPCASASCPFWFVDTSKGGRRRWCSMARCGNRKKAARHRRRQRSASG